jgi:hypothetical protein
MENKEELKKRNHNFFKPVYKRPERDEEKENARSRIKINPDHPPGIPEPKK